MLSNWGLGTADYVLYTACGWRITAATVASHLMLRLVLLACLRAVSLSRARLPWQTSLAASHHDDGTRRCLLPVVRLAARRAFPAMTGLRHVAASATAA